MSDELTSRLRRDARAAFDAAVRTVHPATVVPRAVRERDGMLHAAGLEIERPSGRTVVAALGKAAGTLAASWLEHVPGWCDGLFVLVPHGAPVPEEAAAAATVRRGRHPVPDTDGEASAAALLELASDLGADDLLLVLMSGGASALLATPRAGVGLEDVAATTRILMAAGAPIGVLNAVRRRLLRAGGGGLARAAFPARILTLAISDVVGDHLADIGSGPGVEPPASDAAALGMLDRYVDRKAIPEAVRSALAADPGADDRRWVARTSAAILAGNRTAVGAARAALAAAGYVVRVEGSPLEGEARDVGRRLAGAAERMADGCRSALVAGGETTVTVRGPGRGGRNQELALAAALALDGRHGTVLLAAGTDGVDGASENAGAIVDGDTASRIRSAGLDPSALLDGNDSATALEASGDAIRTGPTGTNVCDVVVIFSAVKV